VHIRGNTQEGTVGAGDFIAVLSLREVEAQVRRSRHEKVEQKRSKANFQVPIG
jgi:hypothetical protein